MSRYGDTTYTLRLYKQLIGGRRFVVFQSTLHRFFLDVAAKPTRAMFVQSQAQQGPRRATLPDPFEIREQISVAARP
jgi:hypothetical protein